MNLGGIKVGSLELEQVLDRHPAVRESAAIGVQPSGEGAERLVVIVVVEKESIDPKSLARELDDALRSRLNPLFRIDDLVLVKRLPRTASNKLMRRELREQYEHSSR